jgi:hypothetical protein
VTVVALTAVPVQIPIVGVGALLVTLATHRLHLHDVVAISHPTLALVAVMVGSRRRVALTAVVPMVMMVGAVVRHLGYPLRRTGAMPDSRAVWADPLLFFLLAALYFLQALVQFLLFLAAVVLEAHDRVDAA